MTKVHGFIGLLTAAALLTAGTASVFAGSFNDAENVWFEEYVEFVHERGLVDGYEDNLYHPYDNVTVAQLCAIIARVDNSEKEKELGNTDEGEYWANRYMSWAAVNNLYHGFLTEDEFAQYSENGIELLGNKPLTREQIITMLYNYCGNDSNEADLTFFADYENVSEYAEKAVCWAVSYGIIEGDDERNINPSANVTRAETAAILTRFVKAVEAAEPEEPTEGAPVTTAEPEGTAKPESTEEPVEIANPMRDYGRLVQDAEEAVGIEFPKLVVNNLILDKFYTINEEDELNAIIEGRGTYNDKNIIIRTGRGDRDISGIYGVTAIDGAPEGYSVDYCEYDGGVSAVWAVTDNENNIICYSVAIEGGTVEELEIIVNAIGAETLESGFDSEA